MSLRSTEDLRWAFDSVSTTRCVWDRSAERSRATTSPGSARTEAFQLSQRSSARAVEATLDRGSTCSPTEPSPPCLRSPSRSHFPLAAVVYLRSATRCGAAASRSTPASRPSASKPSRGRWSSTPRRPSSSASRRSRRSDSQASVGGRMTEGPRQRTEGPLPSTEVRNPTCHRLRGCLSLATRAMASMPAARLCSAPPSTGARSRPAARRAFGAAARLAERTGTARRTAATPSRGGAAPRATTLARSNSVARSARSFARRARAPAKRWVTARAAVDAASMRTANPVTAASVKGAGLRGRTTLRAAEATSAKGVASARVGAAAGDGKRVMPARRTRTARADSVARTSCALGREVAPARSHETNVDRANPASSPRSARKARCARQKVPPHAARPAGSDTRVQATRPVSPSRRWTVVASRLVTPRSMMPAARAGIACRCTRSPLASAWSCAAPRSAVRRTRCVIRLSTSRIKSSSAARPPAPLRWGALVAARDAPRLDSASISDPVPAARPRATLNTLARAAAASGSEAPSLACVSDVGSAGFVGAAAESDQSTDLGL